MRSVTLLSAVVMALAACAEGGEDRGVRRQADSGPERSGGEAGPSTTATSAAGVSAPATLVRLWADGTPAFGVFVPNEAAGSRESSLRRLAPRYTREGAERLAANDLLDYVFLNLEGAYDAEAVNVVAAGLDTAPNGDPPTLLVRIPPLSEDGLEETARRIAASLEAGADGIVLPHIGGVEEARAAVGIFRDLQADVWSPGNPEGSVIVMLMIEDPGALAEAEEISRVAGYSALACGIGSLTRALGDRTAGEAGNQRVLAAATRAGLPDMITANAGDVGRRIDEGFLGLLMSGPGSDEAIRIGRAAAGR